MEKCTRKVNPFSVTRSVYLMGLFDWKLISEEERNQTSNPFNDLLKKMESEGLE